MAAGSLIAGQWTLDPDFYDRICMCNSADVSRKQWNLVALNKGLIAWKTHLKNMWNNEWKKGEDYPEWGDTEVYKKTICGGYLYHGETPKEAYQRVVKTVARDV